VALGKKKENKTNSMTTFSEAVSQQVRPESAMKFYLVWGFLKLA
jgi:hypothetical protein